jgi:hypothetical protein
MALTSTPLLDEATIARFVVEDFDLTEHELAALTDPTIRHTLEDCLREIIDFEDAASRAVELWRERRSR